LIEDKKIASMFCNYQGHLYPTWTATIPVILLDTVDSEIQNEIQNKIQNKIQKKFNIG
jgi:hypothetical protein